MLMSDAKFIIHNYFPPPFTPFVLNLASMNPCIAQRSIEHIEKAMRLSIELDQDTYSFHAGFLIDPIPSELGKGFAPKVLQDREESMKIFIDRVNSLAKKANDLGINLLVENNVLELANLQTDGFSHPFLMVSDEECVRVMRETPKNVNLLVDLAHLKVSSRTLGSNPLEFLAKTRKWTKACHLSDNDGLCDSNEPFALDSWFWPHLDKGLNYYSVEVYDRPIEILIDQLALVRSQIKEPQNAK